MTRSTAALLPSSCSPPARAPRMRFCFRSTTIRRRRRSRPSAPIADDEEVALGAWRETLQDEQRVLEFGPTGAPPLFSLRCDARRGVLLQRHGLASAGDLPVMRVSVGSEARQLAVTGTGGANPDAPRGARRRAIRLLAAMSRRDGADHHPDRRFAAAEPAAEPADRRLCRAVRERRDGARRADAEGNSAAPAGNAAATAGN